MSATRISDQQAEEWAAAAAALLDLVSGWELDRPETVSLALPTVRAQLDGIDPYWPLMASVGLLQRTIDALAAFARTDRDRLIHDLREATARDIATARGQDE